ncbi:MAG TPA: membrane dipeptidase [Rectinemataceae bacterium]|nr:membrane dipeptidase [Rectinemataceae bacterium]
MSAAEQARADKSAGAGEKARTGGTIFYFDAHGHREGLLPKALRLVPGNTIPEDLRLADLARARLGGLVLCVLGDPNSFLPIKIDPYANVLKRLKTAKSTVAEAGGIIARGSGALEAAREKETTAFLLGIEGGDFVGERIDRIDAVFEEGVRLIGLVHYSRNKLGSISYGWGGRVVPQAERTGLTGLGKEAIARANKLGVIVDLAHADDETIRDALAVSEAPMICSHTGPRALQAFPRYIPDELIRGIADGGGIIGLWPFFDKGVGVPDLATFAEYAAYCADLVGSEHLAIGSDCNGVPGYMSGYRNLLDAPKISAALEERGFSADEIAGIAGRNLLRFFGKVTR